MEAESCTNPGGPANGRAAVIGGTRRSGWHNIGLWLSTR